MGRTDRRQTFNQEAGPLPPQLHLQYCLVFPDEHKSGRILSLPTCLHHPSTGSLQGCLHRAWGPRFHLPIGCPLAISSLGPPLQERTSLQYVR